MTIRALTPGDLAAHCRVSSMAFHWNCKLEEETFPEGETLLGCFDGGELIADLEYRVRQATWGSTTLPLVCVGGVASLPQHRRQGAVRQLFAELERLAAQEGWAFGALYPFSDGYYRQFGYERAARCLSLEVPMQALHDFAAGLPKEAGKAELIEGPPPAELLALYNTCAAETPLMLRREPEHARWFHTKPLEDCRYCFLWRGPSGGAEGLVQLQVNRDIGSVEVGEFLFASPAALRGMLRFLRGYASKADKVHFHALPLHSPVPLLLNEHARHKAHVSNGAALRIYDARQALAHFPYAGDGEFRFALEGDGAYHVAYQQGAAQVERAAGPAPVTLTREALVLLMCGHVRDMLALRCCPGVTVAEERGAERLLRAFGHAAGAMMLDGF